MNRFLLIVLSALAAARVCSAQEAPVQPLLGYRDVPLLHVDGLVFKDLNRNGKLDVYEDWRRTPAERAHDLVGQMTLQEIAGQMVHGTVPAPGNPVGMGTTYDFDRAAELITKQHVTSLLTRINPEPATLAALHNRLQQIAEASSLGIPVLVSTDPRNAFQFVFGAGVGGVGFSKFPDPTGLAAIGDANLVRVFGDIVRQEYRAVGIRQALSPQADLATDPRWPRINGTFGEDAEAAKAMVAAYVTGLQNGAGGLNKDSVVATVKHWVGYGAQKDGWDSHNSYARTAVFPGHNFGYHVMPFEGAFAAHVATVMPSYSVLEGLTLEGKPLEPVGVGFNAQLLTGLLRGKYNFDGVVLSDWAITKNCAATCLAGTAPGQAPDLAGIGMPWGVESLTQEQRFAKSINAGVDEIGGTEETQYILNAVHDGMLTRARLELSAYRILFQKFELGLFEDPYVDVSKVDVIVGNESSRRQALEAQEHAVVLLQNKAMLLPLRDTTRKLFLFGIDPAVAKAHGFNVVDKPAAADLAVIRADAPFQTEHPGYIFGARQHEGRLDFRAGDRAFDALLLACAKVPTIVTIYLDRPAILANIVDKTAALLGNFGISDEALFEVLTGHATPQGRLPFELPSSIAAVEGQKEDLPHDSLHPLFPYSFGIQDFGAGRGK